MWKLAETSIILRIWSFLRLLFTSCISMWLLLQASTNPTHSISKSLRRKYSYVVTSLVGDFSHLTKTMPSCLSFECASFDHASHVVMSVIKLMSRIVAPSQLEDLIEGSGGSTTKHAALMKLHDHTYEFPIWPPFVLARIECRILTTIFAPSFLFTKSYGINSDPLTQFACAYSALIHGT